MPQPWDFSNYLSKRYALVFELEAPDYGPQTGVMSTSHLTIQAYGVNGRPGDGAEAHLSKDFSACMKKEKLPSRKMKRNTISPSFLQLDLVVINSTIAPIDPRPRRPDVWFEKE